MRPWILFCCSLVFASISASAAPGVAQPGERANRATLADHSVPDSPQRHAPVATSEREAPRLTLELDEERPPREPSSTLRRWFGWQTVLADSLSLGMLAFEPTALPAFGCMLLLSPIVHFAQGDASDGWASLGLRLVSMTVILLGAVLYLGSVTADEDVEEPKPHAGAKIAGLTLGIIGTGGLLTTMVLDAAFLAFTHDDVAPSHGYAHLSPWADPISGSAGLQLSGRM
jgi:hypothetical protein